MANVIKHRGIVKNVEGNLLTVRIVQTSACAGCGAKGYCSSADVRENQVEVLASDASAYRLGDEVWVMCEMSVVMVYLFRYSGLSLTWRRTIPATSKSGAVSKASRTWRPMLPYPTITALIMMMSLII